jgi:hypothetical protein
MAASNDTKHEISPLHREASALLGELAQEVQVLLVEAGPDISEVSQRRRRGLVRSIFASIEVLAYILRNMAVNNKHPEDIAPEDRLIVSETAYDLDSNGRIVHRSLKLRTTASIRYSFAVFKRSYGTTFDLDVTGASWQAYLRAVMVRDRITHPKKLEDITISEAELMDAAGSWHWFSDAFAAAMLQALEATKAQSAAMKREIVRLCKELNARRAMLSGELPIPH